MSWVMTSLLGGVVTMSKKLTAISLFSGAGGLDLGIEAAGFETRLCVEIDYHSCKTLRQNRRNGKLRNVHPFLQHATVLKRDIRTLTGKDIFRAARLKKGEVSLVYGGPPCQSFSVFGLRKGMDDPRGTLLWEYIRVIREVEPESFIFENVAGLLTIDNGKAFEAFLNEVSKDSLGQEQYTISYYLLDTANYGVPQFRARLIVFGTKNGVKVSKPLQTHNAQILDTDLQLVGHDLKKTPVVRQALQGLPDAPSSTLANHVGRVHSDRIIQRYEHLNFGERDSKTRINRLHPDKPSFTIVVGSDKGGGKGHVHPFEPREVTPRESARIQTFPDYWAFSGTSRHPIRQIGNAVPPVFGAALGVHLLHECFGVNTAPNYDEIIKRLKLDYLQNDECKLGKIAENKQKASLEKMG